MWKSLKRSNRKRNAGIGLSAGALLLVVSGFVTQLDASQGYASLKIAAGAREAAMGEAGVAGATSATAIRWNPSLLLDGTAVELSLHHSRWLVGTSQSAFMVKRNFGRFALGGEVLYFDGGNIELRDSIGSPDPSGTYDFADLSFGLGFAAEVVEGTRIGITGRYYYERLAGYYGHTWGFDAGFNYSPFKGMNLGFSVTDFAFDMHLDGAGFKPPMTLRIGGKYSHLWHDNLGTAFNLDYMYRPYDNEPGLRVGIETNLLKTLSLRAGAKLLYMEDDEIKLVSPSELLTFGVGLTHNWISLDYAIVPYNRLDLGLTHRVSLNLEFD
ncbi:PorV/PorQ family protein [candidate division WOR-3 bacterium]|uniref:PorV/PorQ family protein n=1 Tax=candidate division WOR-3 bacterium TaxID=2052148 RepID=A0A9D5QD67_UNCW3|nr:PorV/PorQ family protein [candidate division WOR-3 bacterium]MBD3365413.1 PorV/PorQ family protein [candidate division WOR-3 bacterium]